MKAVLGIVVLIALIGGGWYLSTRAPSETGNENQNQEEVAAGKQAPAPGTYTVSPQESSVEWTAGKPLIAGYVHHGTFNVKSGSITAAENSASGSFVIDMESVKILSLGGGKAGKESDLEEHLKSDDFFSVEEFPEGTFTITSVVETDTGNTYTVTGNLTLKGITREVMFPAQIYNEEGKLHAHADFTIDRTEWGITFGSANFFDDLANNAIGDDVGLTLKLVAEKQ